MELISSSVFLYVTIGIGLLFVLFWMITRKNLQTLDIKTNSKLDVIQNSFLVIGLVMSMTAVGFLTCHGQSKIDSYTLSTKVYVGVLLVLSLFTFIASLVAISDDALKDKLGDTQEIKDARKSFKNWLTGFSVVSGIFVGICIVYIFFQLRKKGVFSPADGAIMSPIEGVELSPVDGLTLSPVDGADLSPVDGATMSPSFGFDFQF